MRDVMLDLRLAARSLRRTPGFTAAAAITLALGIGATTAIFTVVNAAILTPLPYPSPERLLVLSRTQGGALSGQLFLHVRERTRVFDTVTAQRGGGIVNLTTAAGVDAVAAQRVSERFFETHGVPLRLGREFSRAEDQPDGPRAVILSDALWRRVYRGDAAAVGQTLRLGDDLHTIVGIADARFRSVPETDLWLPLRTTPGDNGFNYRVVGRLRADVTDPQVAADLKVLRGSARQAFPRYGTETIQGLAWTPYREFLSFASRQLSLLLLAAVAVLLLIACVNVASLHLSRALARRRELAVRVALGSSRARLLRLVLTEALLLASVGAAGGLAVAIACTRILSGLVSEQTWRPLFNDEALVIDWRVLTFCAVVAVASALLAVAPAFASARIDLRSAMSEGISTTQGRRTLWLRRSLAGAEMTLACVLLVGAGLLTRTFVNLTHAPLGFNPGGVLIGRMSLQGAIDAATFESLLARAVERVHQVPGITAVSASNGVPVERAINLGLQPPAGSRVTQPRAVDWRFVTAEYFAAFEMQPLAGRLFDERDRAASAPVTIVNEAFARGYFGRLDVVGETIPMGTIVGVIGNSKGRSGSGWTGGLTALGSGSAPTMFQPAGQAAAGAPTGARRVFDLTWAMRTNAPHPTREHEIQQALHAIDPRLTVLSFEPMDAVVARDLDIPRFAANLFAGFAVLAVALAAIGLYGLMSYAAAQRTREVGIRLAFGATSSRILTHFLSEGIGVAATGLLAGLGIASLATTALATLLFGVTPLDTPTFAAVAGLLLLTGALAALGPALRAARLSPVRALKMD